MPRLVSRVGTLSSLKKINMSVEKRRFRTYEIDGLRSMDDLYLGKVRSDGHIYLLPLPTDGYEPNAEVKYG